jgi:death-on-curing protein
MTDWRWVALKVVQAIHDSQLAEHGGLDGIRDEGALESALDRPKNQIAYGNPDIAALAACYMASLARSHSYVDGNKRTAWVTGRVFLADNGYTLNIERRDAVVWMLNVTTGTVSEDQFAEFLRQRITPLGA